jgi:pre-mRNA-processing factor 39
MAAYEKAVIENNKRKIFESGIKQSYFTHKPLDDEQVMNWRKYLEFEESEGDNERTVLLYERCIVPTCYIPEFWIRYARFLEKTAGESTARELYKRANTNFLFRKPELFVYQGYFEEVHGNVEEARRLYKHAYEKIGKRYVAPGLVEGVYKHINLERKAQNYDEVVRLYELAIDVAKQNNDSYTIAFISCHFARFLQHHLNDLDRALSVYEAAINLTTGHNFLYNLYIVGLWSLSDPISRLDRIKKVYEAAVNERNNLIEEERLELWLSYINFIRNHWPDRQETRDIEERFRRSFHHSNQFQSRFRQSCRIKQVRSARPFSYDNPLKRMKLDNE